MTDHPKSDPCLLTPEQDAAAKALIARAFGADRPQPREEAAIRSARSAFLPIRRILPGVGRLAALVEVVVHSGFLPRYGRDLAGSSRFPSRSADPPVRGVRDPLRRRCPRRPKANTGKRCAVRSTLCFHENGHSSSARCGEIRTPPPLRKGTTTVVGNAERNAP